MNFSEALKAMEMGNKVSREAWRGKISYWHMTKANNRESIQAVLPDGKERPPIGSIAIVNILADDWWIVT